MKIAILLWIIVICASLGGYIWFTSAPTAGTITLMVIMYVLGSVFSAVEILAVIEACVETRRVIRLCRVFRGR